MPVKDKQIVMENAMIWAKLRGELFGEGNE